MRPVLLARALSPDAPQLDGRKFGEAAWRPDRGRKGFRLPSLRTVRAVLPHTALQSLVSSSGVPRAFVSCFEGEQPAIREKDIWPAAVVLESATAAGTLRLLAQD